MGDIFDGSKNQALKKWELDILLKWHNQDPVSRREIDRILNFKMRKR